MRQAPHPSKRGQHHGRLQLRIRAQTITRLEQGDVQAGLQVLLVTFERSDLVELRLGSTIEQRFVHIAIEAADG